LCSTADFLMGERIKVLLSTYACEPDKGSEPYVGWSWANALAQHCDVTVLTRANNRGPIEKALASMSGRLPAFIYYDPCSSLLTLKKAGLPVSIFYVFWQIGARRCMASKLGLFDIVHHLTFNSFTVPGFWWTKRAVVVLGPLGGGMVTPLKMIGLFGKKMPGELLRTIFVLLSSWNPLVRFSFAKARTIISANNDTEKRIPHVFRHKSARMLETGINVERVLGAKSHNGLRLLWVGTLTARKAPLLALLALAKCRTAGLHAHLEFIGQGPELEKLQQIATKLDLLNHVTFTGFLPHAVVVDKFRDADIFLFTSIRDTSGNVLLEAMAAGLPSVILCHQGAAEITTPETAIRILPDSPERVASRLAEGILTLAGNTELRIRMGEAARQRVVEQFTWEKKSEAMLAIYRRVLGQTTA
jgi:glycosyltransferase involved in cell wall biosynthesis